MTKFINWTCVLAAAFGDLMRMQRLCELRGEAASRLQDAVLRLTNANFRGSAVWKKRAAKQSMLQVGIHNYLPARPCHTMNCLQSGMPDHNQLEMMIA